MKIKINNKEVTLTDGATIKGIADEQQLPATGVAIAVNNDMVPREQWSNTAVKDGDDIVILKAFCGG